MNAQQKTRETKNELADKPNEQNQPVPYVGRPLDGSQYVDVIEEQVYSEQRPTAEEQRPRHTAGEPKHKADHHETATSIGEHDAS